MKPTEQLPAEIIHGINEALSPEHKAKCKMVKSPYGDGHAAENIAKEIMATLEGSIDLKKKFYDCL